MKGSKKPGASNAQNKALFHPFETAPPPGGICMDKLYNLFATTSVRWNWCRQCFSPELEQRMREYPIVRTAPGCAFDMIYYEHPSCSGGRETFLHWLPRGLEIRFFDTRPYPSLLYQMARMGLLAWPGEWLIPLRQLLCRASINWFIAGHTQPLELSQDDNQRVMSDSAIGQELVAALCQVRIDPRSIATWLLNIDTFRSWSAALCLLQSERILGDPVYYVLPQDGWEAEFHAAQDALDRRLRSDLYSVFSKEILLQKWIREVKRDPCLADLISKAESMMDAYPRQQSREDRDADEERIRRVIGLPVIDV